jgi:sigma-B regulation protein RsbU (phosphoserine phosphatase)
MEHELHLRQLQLRSLLTITQAINDNVSASGLFDMYKNFLAWEMEVDRMALFTKVEEDWECVVSINVDYKIDHDEVIQNLLEYNRLHTITKQDHPLVREFDILIPVYHKNDPIAYTLIGGFKDEEDLYNKIQFITTITNIISVAIENKRLFKQQIQQERLQKEIELAEEVQRMLIPDHLPTSKEFNIASIYKPHFNVGGDYFDYIPVDEDRFVICIGDISGKGVAAAILMANFQAILKVVIRKSENLKNLVRDLNKNVFEITKSDKFITFFIALVDLKKQKISYVNAGHNPPVVLEDGLVSALDVGSTVLGAVENLPKIESGTYNFTERTLLLTYTDGLTDLKNEEGEYFDHEEILEFLTNNPDINAHEFNNRLHRRLETFRGNKAYPDDIAILTCQITPERKKMAAAAQ